MLTGILCDQKNFFEPGCFNTMELPLRRTLVHSVHYSSIHDQPNPFILHLLIFKFSHFHIYYTLVQTIPQHEKIK